MWRLPDVGCMWAHDAIVSEFNLRSAEKAAERIAKAVLQAEVRIK